MVTEKLQNSDNDKFLVGLGRLLKFLESQGFTVKQIEKHTLGYWINWIKSNQKRDDMKYSKFSEGERE